MTKLIAEIGWNFIGNLDLAKEMIAATRVWCRLCEISDMVD